MGEAAFLSYGWRFAFLLSALLVIVGMVVRLKVVETPAFAAMRSRERASAVPAADLLRNRLGRRHLLLGMGIFAARLGFRRTPLSAPSGSWSHPS